MISTQRIAETVHRSVLLELTARRNEQAAIPLAPVDGMRRNAAIVADGWVTRKFQQLQEAKHHKAYDEAAIRDHAENYATLCGRMSSLELRRNFGASVGIQPTKGRKVTAAGEKKRWDDPVWWRRQLRKVWTRQSEDALREIGVIRRGKQPYASDAAVEHRAGRMARTREWFEGRKMVSDEGEEVPLLELHEKSQANPTIRRGEFMCRIRGFEEFAESQGHVALFWTLTTPSRFHAWHSGGGTNEKWKDERARVRDAQAWLCKQWARARAQLARRSIPFYGARVAEAHHDGTPHWHALIWIPPQHADAMRELLREVWLKDSGDEDGAQLRRITCKEIDREKGSAVGYIAKYIAKNIDGAGAAADMLDDETGEPVGKFDVGSADDPESAKRRLKSSIHRVAAWASVHGIRQFQQVGGPPVGLWRELRRVREPVPQTLIESIRAPADTGKWAEFIGALGGIERSRRRVGSLRTKYRRTLRVPKVRVRRLATKQWRKKCGPRVAWTTRAARPDELPAAWLDREHPQVVDTAGRTVEAISRYGENPEPRAAGVVSYTCAADRYAVVDTRIHKWRIEKKCASTSLSRSTEGDTSTSKPRGLHVQMARADGTIAESCSGFLSDSRSGLGPVAITVRSSEEDAAIVAAMVAAAKSRPGWVAFDERAYIWPDDVEPFKKPPGAAGGRSEKCH